MRILKKLLLLFICCLPLHLFAHGSHGTGFVAGLTHPVFGLDHMLAIVSIGILSFSLLKDRPVVPVLAFIFAMVVGGMHGISVDSFAITEYVIVLSVVIGGFLLAFQMSMSWLVYVLLFAFFGFFHGHAHGTEMPIDSNVPLYVLGFVVGVLLLIAVAYGIQKLIKDVSNLKLLGAFVAGMGMMMLLA